MAPPLEVAGIILCWEFLRRGVLAAFLHRRTGAQASGLPDVAPVALDSNSLAQQQLLYLEEEAERKRERHNEEMAQLRMEWEQKRQRREKDLAEVSARSAQKVEESYFARLAGLAKALETGLIDQAEHDRRVHAFQSMM